MYTDFYKLQGLPFQLSPDPRFFFGSSGHQKAMAYLTYGLHQGEGFIIVTGDIGAGKTTLVGHLFSNLDAAKFIAAKLVTTQLEADDTLRMVATAFGIGQAGADKAQLLERIEAFLVATHAAGKRSLLVIDEVQNLSVRALEELRMLSNFQVGGKALLQSFLLGQPQFRTTLASDELEQLRQRVIASYHLGPLDAGETHSYIEHRLQLVGWQDDPHFTPEAFELVHEKTGGVPRKINALCSRVLLNGFLEELHEIDDGVVAKVSKELDDEIAQVMASPADRAAGALVDAQAANGRLNGGYRNGDSDDLGPPGTDLADRISVLEQHVRTHERTIKRALEIAAEYLSGSKP
jgi:putative secretion ATPase (PEP-CTERM system associated)